MELRRPTIDGDIAPYAKDVFANYYSLCEGPNAAGYSWGATGYSNWCYGNMGPQLDHGHEFANTTGDFPVSGKTLSGGSCTTDVAVNFIAKRERYLACPGINEQAFIFTSGATPSLCSLYWYYYVNPKQCNTCSDDRGGNVDLVTVGDSIDPITGVKSQVEVDYVGNGPQPLRFERVYYNRIYHLDGKFWRHNYSARIEYQDFGTVPVAITHRPRGQAFIFKLSGAQFVADVDINDRLTKLTDGGGALTGWQYYVANSDATETYDVEGKLVSIQNRAGLVQTLEYSTASTPPSIAKESGLLIRVTDAFGRQLNFTYDAIARMATMQDPAGQTYTYTYVSGTPVSNLGYSLVTSVLYPDTKTRTYLYNEAGLASGYAGKLTGVVDENNSRFATYTYAGDRVTQSKHAGNVDTVTVNFGSWPGTWPNSMTVTDPRGTVRTYSYELKNGVRLNNSITQPAVGGGTVSATKTYGDANGNVTMRKDFNGNRTNYTYDLTRNLETSRTEGLTSAGAVTPATRTIETQWHATLRIPTQVTDKDSYGAVVRVTAMTHDSNGNVLTRTITAGANSRTWTYTYNANGSVLTVDGPRTDVADTTTYTYYANNDADLGKRGNVATITNALGHVTNIMAYNGHGQPLTVVDANGLTTTLTYDQRQRLKTRDVGGELTTYDYDGVGQLTKVTLPDASFLSYTYDAAHRLTAIQDNLGNRIAYTLDVMGNRTLEEVRDPGNQLAQTKSRAYNELNRLSQELALGQTTNFGYDNQGNSTSVTKVITPQDLVTNNQYDALNRLKQMTDPNSGVTQYAYNPLDALTQVTDPRNLTTTYGVDGLGNLNQLASPDAGTTINTYDAAGNLATQTDAKNQVTTYTYDVLNRVTLITFHDGSKQTYGYDQGANGLGRLSSIEERNPSNQVIALTQYGYDQKGRVTSDARTVNGIVYTTGYGYDSFGRLSQVTYPSGRTATYTFDALGRVTQVTTTKNAQQQVVVQNVQYHPFGGVKSFTLGNGQVYSRSIDTDGRIASYTLGSSNYSVSFDAASRITGIAEVGNPSNANTYVYDLVDRLTSAVLPSSTFGYGYDAVGNRQTKTVGAATDTYAYGAGSNRISSITPASGPVRNFVFDANGSTTSDALNTYAYDTRGRMVQATSGVGATDYQVNALGQRIRKTNSSGDGVFHYDSAGRLIDESSAAGVLRREYLYLGDIPVGIVVAP